MAVSRNEQIKNSIKATRERHDAMLCRVFEVKIIANKLSGQKKELLDALFREAKWLRNSELAKGDASLFNRNAKSALVKVGSSFEERQLTHLGSQIKQDIVDSIKSEIRGLATKKEAGEHVGRLKFKSFCNSVPLRQYGKTYRIDFDENTVSIQKFAKLPFKVKGLKQIPADAEIANARLVRKPSGYYFHITVYTKPVKRQETGLAVGIDFGIKTNLTLSNGLCFDIYVPETKGVKLASRRANRAYHKNGRVKTKNHFKQKRKLRAAYERQNNMKRDAANKIVHLLLKDYDFIAMQDELISAWHKGLFGKQVQHSAMGLIKSKLKTSLQTCIVPASFASTQACPVCGRNTKHSLSERTYTCSYCGYHHPDRDVKAACSILECAVQQVSAERRT